MIAPTGTSVQHLNIFERFFRPCFINQIFLEFRCICAERVGKEDACCISIFKWVRNIQIESFLNFFESVYIFRWAFVFQNWRRMWPCPIDGFLLDTVGDRLAHTFLSTKFACLTKLLFLYYNQWLTEPSLWGLRVRKSFQPTRTRVLLSETNDRFCCGFVCSFITYMPRG